MKGYVGVKQFVQVQVEILIVRVVAFSCAEVKTGDSHKV